MACLARLCAGALWVPLALLGIGCGSDASAPEGSTDGGSGGEALPNLPFVADRPSWTGIIDDFPPHDEYEDESAPRLAVEDGEAIASAQRRVWDGDTLYVLSDGGVSMFDASGQAPDLITQIHTDDAPFSMRIEGEYAYLWTRDDVAVQSTLTTLRLEPTGPVEVASTQVAGAVQFSTVDASTLVALTVWPDRCDDCETNGLRTHAFAIDLSDPAAPVAGESTEFGNQGQTGNSRPRRVDYDGGRLAVAVPTGEGTRVHVLELGQQGFEELGALGVAGFVRWLDLQGDVVRIGSMANDVIRLEMLDVATTEIVGSVGVAAEWGDVGFDADSAYVVTSDGLTVFDLTNPQVPRYVDQAPIPGGSQLLDVEAGRALVLASVDNPGGGSSTSVSLVSVDAAPSVLSTVQIQGDWALMSQSAHLDEGLAPAEGLIALPMELQTFLPEGSCPDVESRDGVQLVRWQNDALSLGGFVEGRGQSVAATWQGDRLFSVTDQTVEGIDIRAEGGPAVAGRVQIRSAVEKTVAVGDSLVRLSVDARTGHDVLDVVAQADAAKPRALGRLELDYPIAEWTECGGGYWTEHLLSKDDFVYLVGFRYGQDQDHQRTVTVVDVSDPAAPAKVGEVRTAAGTEGRELWSGPAGETAALVGDALVIHWVESSILEHEDDPLLDEPRSQARFEVYDLTDPGQPQLATTLERPDALAHGGIVVQGEEAFSWHAIAADETAETMHIMLERLDVSDPRAASLSEPLNVPGAPLGVSGGRVLTTDEREDVPRQQTVVLSALQAAEAVAIENTVEGYSHGLFVTPDRVFAYDEATHAMSFVVIDWTDPALPTSAPLAIDDWSRTIDFSFAAAGEKAVMTWPNHVVWIDGTSVSAATLIRGERAPTTCRELRLTDPGATCADGRRVELLAP